jgi:hypothetical protein
MEFVLVDIKVNGIVDSSKTIFDVGMYDAADCTYYLAEGHRVIAIEANPTFVRKAEAHLADAVSSGQLILVNGAVAVAMGQSSYIYAMKI